MIVCSECKRGILEPSDTSKLGGFGWTGAYSRAANANGAYLFSKHYISFYRHWRFEIRPTYIFTFSARELSDVIPYKAELVCRAINDAVFPLGQVVQFPNNFFATMVQNMH